MCRFSTWRKSAIVRRALSGSVKLSDNNAVAECNLILLFGKLIFRFVSGSHIDRLPDFPRTANPWSGAWRHKYGSHLFYWFLTIRSVKGSLTNISNHWAAVRIREFEHEI
jgi:hypothetical protein